ncbi:DNA-processing protein DprA [Massilia horti]|uniref:DNA-protecting protein DprA n=1 Tax=Massilia horti TaxID=2562153 RepID=A0A4Y9ST42_9BURK|nr:DNA-processing protein DprA [Massilia horti]TFW29962.1 DNA-protecting protein DprA [Massilia horti]
MQDTDPIPAASRNRQIADWLRLEQAAGVGCRTARLLLNQFGSPQAIFNAGNAALAAHVSPAQARALCAPPPRETAALIEATLAWLAQPNHHVLTLHDAAYPPLLANIDDPPLLLYLKGRIELLRQPALGIIGSRNASEQGKTSARSFAHALANAGLTIVSGLALGIDAAAHEGALAGPGSTIAVVGTGLDRIYPARNEALARRIAVEGCIVSEYALGTPPIASNFPRRNRVISALSAGVLVVEAAAQSGSLITANLAAEQGREVFALPGSIHSSLSKGCHKLIRDGAQLVETADEILAALHMSPLVAAPAVAQSECLPEDTPLLAALGHGPVEFDALLARIGSTAAALNSELLMFELDGQIERLPGGQFQRIFR